MVPSIQNVYTLASALLTGETVDAERLQKRLEICATCPSAVKDGKGDLVSCGVCGCRLKGDRSFVNLARYVETPLYGCKARGGSRWQKAGV